MAPAACLLPLTVATRPPPGFALCSCLVWGVEAGRGGAGAGGCGVVWCGVVWWRGVREGRGTLLLSFP